MKVAIMQPYFFPYSGYFSLISAVDYWVFFDTAQYIRHGWVNRNRILKPSGDDWQYISVPLTKHHRSDPINKVVPKDSDWASRILSQLAHYKRSAPFYKEIIELVGEVLQTWKNGESISTLNIKSVQAVCDYLGIDRKMQVFSEMSVDIKGVNEPDEWALEITKLLSGDCYINPIGGQSFFNNEKYKKNGIDLLFLNPRINPYPQKGKMFIPGLSIIDILMFCSPKDAIEMIEEYNLE